MLLLKRPNAPGAALLPKAAELNKALFYSRSDNMLPAKETLKRPKKGFA